MAEDTSAAKRRAQVILQELLRSGEVSVGADGIPHEHGLTTNYPDPATIHRAMTRQARRRVVVADHRKLGVTASALICPVDGVDVLITDRGATDEALAPFVARGIEVRKA